LIPAHVPELADRRGAQPSPRPAAGCEAVERSIGLGSPHRVASDEVRDMSVPAKHADHAPFFHLPQQLAEPRLGLEGANLQRLHAAIV